MKIELELLKHERGLNKDTLRAVKYDEAGKFITDIAETAVDSSSQDQMRSAKRKLARNFKLADHALSNTVVEEKRGRYQNLYESEKARFEAMP